MLEGAFLRERPSGGAGLARYAADGATAGDAGAASTTGAPELSIVICTRNRAASLAGTLKSLTEIRAVHSWEVLFVDNASTDDTAAVLAAADDCGGRLRYVREERVGLGAARDTGWRRSRGRLVCFTDDDCYLTPDYVDAMVEAYRRRPHLGCIGGRIMLFDRDDLPVTIDERDSPDEIAPYQFIPAGAIHGANLSFRRSVLESIGGFDVQLGTGTPYPCDDIDVIASTLWSGVTIGFDPAPVVYHHHRRREPDYDGLIEVYDRGRGVYYAKWMLRRDTRKAYLKGWLAVAGQQQTLPGLKRLAREIKAARAYLRMRKETGALLLTAPIAGLLQLGIWVLIQRYEGELKVRRLARRLLK